MPIPTPEPGLVISYAYLWHCEHKSGHEEGRKDRPCVIVLAVAQTDDAPLVTVLPVTHIEPPDAASGIEIPASVKRHLGLDDLRSWIIVSEGNEFFWPGYDIRKLDRSDRYTYGFLPPRFFNQVLASFLNWHRLSKPRVISRE